MAELLRLTSFGPRNLLETSQLNADAAAGQAVITPKNVEGFGSADADKYMIVGEPGSEQAEIREVSSLTATTITFSANLTFTHRRFEKVLKLFGNQIKVYRAPNVNGKPPADDAYTNIATVSIQPDQEFVEFNDPTGGSDFWYKQTYYNSASLGETDKADSVAVRGGDFGHFATLWEIRSEAGMQNNPELTDEIISDRRDDAESEVKGAITAAGYTLPFAADIPTPPTVKNATKLLAAGYILLQDYGVLSEGSNKEGNAKVRLAREILKQIRDREVVLLDITEAQISAGNQIKGWPDDSTKDASAEDAGGKRIFRISDKF